MEEKLNFDKNINKSIYIKIENIVTHNTRLTPCPSKVLPMRGVRLLQYIGHLYKDIKEINNSDYKCQKKQVI